MAFFKTRCSKCLKVTDSKLFAVPAKTFLPPSRTGHSDAGGSPHVPHVVSPRLVPPWQSRGEKPAGMSSGAPSLGKALSVEQV